MGSQLCERFQSAKMSTAAEKSKPKKSTTKTTKKMEQAHPPSSVMIVKAIEDLKEKKGSSLASIKKYIGANYKVDLTKLSVHIRRALKSGIEKKTITASAGMAGRFKIAKAESKPKAKPKTPKKVKTPSKKKTKPSKKATPKKAEKTKSVKKTATKKPVPKKAKKGPATKKAAPKK